MPIRFTDSGIKQTGLMSQSNDPAGYTGLSGALNFKRNKYSREDLKPHLLQIGMKEPGLRQASVPIVGLQSKGPQRGISLSARAASRGNFSFDKVKRDEMKRNLSYNRNPNINPYQ